MCLPCLSGLLKLGRTGIDLVSFEQPITYRDKIFKHKLELFLDTAPRRRTSRSAVLDRGRQIGGLSWSANFPPRRVHLFPPHLLSKNEAEMCWPLHEVGGGVNDLHCCTTHNRGVLKPRNS